MTGVTLEDPHTEDLSQDVRGFIFSRILVGLFSLPSQDLLTYFNLMDQEYLY